MWSVYIHNGKVLIPSKANTEAGYSLEIEPVRVADIQDTEAIALALEQTMAEGNPTVPTPTRARFPKPVVLGPAGVRSWNEFVRSAVSVSVYREGGKFKIIPSKHDEEGAWIDDLEKTFLMPESVSTIELVRRMVGTVHQERNHE
jgi:hypothetical protein